MTNENTALIVGISGQDGSYLAQLLHGKGYKIHGVSRDCETNGFHRLKILGVLEKVNLHSASIHDFRSILSLISDVRPTEIYNLAGQSSVGLSFKQPIETMESIVIGNYNILEVIRFLQLDTRYYNASSSECFGNVDGKAANEQTAFKPKSPYGVAKSAAHMAVANYREAYELFACSGILFNHESPLRPARFVTAKIVRGAVDIAEKKLNKLNLGNLTIERDWGWAPEYVDAMWRMLQANVPNDFVIATGESHTLEKFVSCVFDMLGLDWRNHVVRSSDLKRPSDIQRSLGDPKRAKKLLDWEAEIKFQDIVNLLVNGELERRKLNQN